jgi:broad specificity phosphatase PhoE
MLKAPGINIDYTVLPKDWTSKSGKWAADLDALRERSRSARLWLKERMEEHIVCVLHGGFLHYLTDDWKGHGDFPGTGWNNTEFRTYVFDGQSMVETEESRQRRVGEMPLSKTEKM